jgi:uncharacterized repeat protein (TIGR01451 family)
VTIAGSAGGTGILTNCCGVTYALPLCVQTRVVQPALAITKQITPESILNCDTITMTIEVKNTGSGNASNVHILDTLPAGLTTMDGKSSIDVPLGNLASGQSRPVTMQLKASKTGRYENMASATADGNLKADSGKVVTVVKQPVLAIDCKPGAERVVLGRDATFCFTVRNTGDAVSAETRVVATLPAGASFVSADNGGAASAGAVTWNVGALPPGQTKTLCVTVKPASASAVALSATAQGKCAAQVSTTCQTNVIGIPAMLLDGSDEPDPVQIGGTTTYTLTITNQGFADLTNVSLVCTLDDAKVMQYVSSSSGGSANGTTVTFPTIAVLKPKEKRTYTITVKAVGEGQVQMKAEAKSTEITRTLIKTETTNFYK